MKHAALLLASGCVVLLSACQHTDVQTPIIPVKTETTAGHMYSGEAIEFLKTDHVTREEVRATLGPPLVESPATGVWVYAWDRKTTILPFQLVLKDRDTLSGIETETPAGAGGNLGTITRRTALFIAFDDEGFVVAHDVRRIDGMTLEEACADWRREIERNSVRAD